MYFRCVKYVVICLLKFNTYYIVSNAIIIYYHTVMKYLICYHMFEHLYIVYNALITSLTIIINVIMTLYIILTSSVQCLIFVSNSIVWLWIDSLFIRSHMFNIFSKSFTWFIICLLYFVILSDFCVSCRRRVSLSPDIYFWICQIRVCLLYKIVNTL